MTEREWRWKRLHDNSYVNINIPIINEYLRANSYTLPRLAKVMGVNYDLIKTCFEKRRMGTALYKRMCERLGAPYSKLTTDSEDNMWKTPVKIHVPQKINKQEYAAEPKKELTIIEGPININGTSLYNYLKNNHITQISISTKLGKDKTAVNKYITNNSMPYSVYLEMCKILNVDENKFLDLTNTYSRKEKPEPKKVSQRVTADCKKTTPVKECVCFDVENLNIACKSYGLSAATFSLKNGKSKDYLGRCLRGVSKSIEYEFLVELCKTVNVKIEDIIDWDNIPERSPHHNYNKTMVNKRHKRVETPIITEKPIITHTDNEEKILIDKREFDSVMMQLDELVSNFTWFGAVFQKLQEPINSSIEQIEQLKNRVNKLSKE